ncbi:protein p13 MTCP-1-like isoform 3-T5 [Porphyrio hochstetteri]
MTEGMAEGGRPGTPPVRLWVRRVGVYCDEHRKTWLVAAEEEEGMLRARIQRVQVPLGEALRPSQLPPSRLPHMWQLSQGDLVVLKSCCLNSCLVINMEQWL